MIFEPKKVLLAVLAAFLLLIALPAVSGGPFDLGFDARANTPAKKPAARSGPPACSCACKSGTTCKSGGSEVACDSYKATYCTGSKQPSR